MLIKFEQYGASQNILIYMMCPCNTEAFSISISVRKLLMLHCYNFKAPVMIKKIFLNSFEI